MKKHYIYFLHLVCYTFLFLLSLFYSQILLFKEQVRVFDKKKKRYLSAHNFHLQKREVIKSYMISLLFPPLFHVLQ